MTAAAVALDYGPAYSIVSGSDAMVVYSPLVYATNQRLILFSHGRAGDAFQMLPSATSSDPGGVYKVVRELVRRGYVVAGFTFSSTTNWGSPTAVTIVNTHLTAQATPLRVSTSKVGWLAYSMGYALASNWTRANPTKTAVMVGVAPATDLDEAYSRGGTFATQIDAAYSTWASAGGNNYDPIDSISTLAGIKRQLWAGSSDTTILPGDVSGGVLRYANACAAADVDMHTVAGDHGTVWANVDPVTVADYVDANWS